MDNGKWRNVVAAAMDLNGLYYVQVEEEEKEEAIDLLNKKVIQFQRMV